MCGVVGMIAKQSVVQEIYDGLIILQHRGQDAAGIMTCDQGKLFLRKGNGLVRDVFHTRHIQRLQGTMGIGHVRYPTAGSHQEAEAQPLYVNSPYGICLAHNGNLTNAKQLERELYVDDLRHLSTSSDTEVLLNVFAHELQRIHQLRLQPATIFEAVAAVHKRCQGGYAVVSMITGYGMVAFRDPHGIRPLVYGKRETQQGIEYMVASESVALSAQGFSDITDIAPGEAVYISLDGQLHRQQCAQHSLLTPCLFEFVYLARPDSLLDGISVYKMRLRMGEKLGEKILREYPNHDIDVVIPIPDTSRTAALPLANKLGVKYREGFVKNRYIGRTFIMPEQSLRRRSVRQKLNAIDLEFRGKNVLLVDDSIVRGTTSREIIQMARDSGANKVYFASAAPEVKYPNVYGIDMPTHDELFANNKSLQEMQQTIGADWLLFQDLSALVEAAQEGNPDIQRFEDSVFSGQYITGDVDDAYLKNLANLHSYS